MEDRPDEKPMKLRYAGSCRLCEVELVAGTVAIYERSTKTIRCLTHVEPTTMVVPAELSEPAAIDVGTPGASARREFDRRHQARKERVGTKHPKLGRVILALADDPQSTTAWGTGAIGEERLGTRLNELSTDSLLLLHDRRMPRSKANIDHVAVTPTGIWVIDAKKYRERPSLKVEGGFIKQRTEKLLVGSRDCSKLVDGMLKQMDVVRDALLPAAGPEAQERQGEGVAIHGVLCFVEADWPSIGGAFEVRGVEVLRPKKLYPRLQAKGPLEPHSIAEIQRLLSVALPPA